jgi:hypothetical protein
MKSGAHLVKTSERTTTKGMNQCHKSSLGHTVSSESVAKDGPRKVVWPFDQIVGVAV